MSLFRQKATIASVRHWATRLTRTLIKIFYCICKNTRKKKDFFRAIHCYQSSFVKSTHNVATLPHWCQRTTSVLSRITKSNALTFSTFSTTDSTFQGLMFSGDSGNKVKAWEFVRKTVRRGTSCRRVDSSVVWPGNLEKWNKIRLFSKMFMIWLFLRADDIDPFYPLRMLVRFDAS